MNKTKVEGVVDQAKGKIKESFGEATGNQKMANSGAADKVKGNAKEAMGDVKDTAGKIRDDAGRKADAKTDRKAQDARGSVTSTTEKLKDKIKGGLDHLEHRTK